MKQSFDEFVERNWPSKEDAMGQPKEFNLVNVKEAKPKQTGMALEMDVLKKIAHQIDRLPDGDAGGRVLEFVRRAFEEKKLNRLATAAPTGQLGFPE